MEQEQLTLYKLMILYLIEKVDFPLSNSQISEFILDKGYTNYFTVQRAFHELEEENMLRVKQIRNMSHYALSDEGSEAIEMFEYQIPNSIKEDIAQFLKEKEYELRKEASVTADFYPSKGDEYTVNLKIREKENLPQGKANEILNKKSGLLGISGVSSDMRDVTSAADAGNERAKLATEMLAYQIKKYVGSYAAAMGGLDCLVFTGGIGENDNRVRASVCENMGFLGISVDPAKNQQRTSDILDISGKGSRVKVLVVCTNEELMIARDTKALVEARR